MVGEHLILLEQVLVQGLGFVERTSDQFGFNYGLVLVDVREFS